MSPKKGRSYLYHGSGYGFAAHFTHPTKSTIPTQASAVLSPTGGEAFASVKKFNYQDTITFDEASTYLVGTEDPDGSRHTVVNVTVRNFRFLGVIHADLIATRVATIHRPGKDDRYDEPDIHLAGSFIHGLTVAGHEMDITFHPQRFGESPTFEKFSKKRPNKKIASTPFDDDTRHVASLVKEIKGCDELTVKERDHIYDNDEYDIDCVRRRGHVIVVPHFGKIHLGEVVVQRGYRRVTMLRIELGCGTGGGGGVGGGEGNGGEIPPSLG